MNRVDRQIRRALDLALAITACCCSTAALAADARTEAIANGYRPLAAVGPAASRPGGAEASDTYLKLLEPRRTVAVLTVPKPVGGPPSDYSVLTVAIDCKAGAVKYRSIQALDAQWNPKASGLPLPKTVWHRPTPGSAADQAISLGCAKRP